MTGPAVDALHSFWNRARAVLPSLSADLPSAWSFGATPEHADELLELVLSGTKTGTASSLWDHEATGELVPQPGELSIIIDGAGRPRAVEAFAGALAAGRALGVDLLRPPSYL